jgi:hypothetical protein
MHSKSEAAVAKADHDDGIPSPPTSEIPWWARMDIDRWQQHLMNASEEEAEGSWQDFRLLSDKPGCLIVEALEVDCLLIISSKEGVTFIKCYGEDGCQTYVGIQEDFHEVYVTIKKRG